MLLVERADETPAFDCEQWYRLNVLRLRPAHDDLLYASIAAGDQVRVSEEESPGSDRSHALQVRRRLPHEISIVVLQISARADAFRPARRVRARRKSRKEVRSRAERFHFVLHEFVQPLNDRRHGNHRRHSDDDAQHGKGGAHLRGTQCFHRREKIFPRLRKCHQRHQSDLNATIGSSCEARNAG